MQRFPRMLVATLALSSPWLPAQVQRLELARREPIASGASFGESGSYEVIQGTLHFALDPSEPRNQRIVDLDRAPRNDDGLVTSSADFLALQPIDPSKRRGLALVEVSNRGGKASLSYFNGGRGSDLSSPRAAGDGLLMRLGLTVVWCGWQFDVPDGDRLRLEVPRAKNPDGSSIEGLVRSDWVVDRATETLPLAHRNHRPYRPVRPDSDEHVLTRRSGRDAARERMPRTAWQFSEDRAAIRSAKGFAPGFIYELVYRAQDPAVVGMGLAAIRDVISWMKHDSSCPCPVERGVAIGISQTGRFLRHFIWQGFNTDTRGHRAYDGILALTAGAGRGSFNHRFAQPSRDAHRYSAFVYPTDVFPFTSTLQEDPESGRMDGLFARQHDPAHLPKVFWINTGYEYWGRAAALIHTSVDGQRDIEPTARERIYHVAGAQHYPTSVGRGNPIDLRATYRALAVAMFDWVDRDVEPPASAYPRLADGTLTPRSKLRTSGVAATPAHAHTAYRADYGPRFWSEGIVTTQPPRLGATFPELVPQVDELGNERGGLRGMELLVPVGTYLPHSLRQDGEMRDFVGRFVPLPRAATTDDARTPLKAAYTTEAEYDSAIAAALDRLIEERLLLTEDRQRMRDHARRLWQFAAGARRR